MFEDKISQRIVPLPAFIFPVLEVCYYFGLNLCLSIDSVPIKTSCILCVIPLRNFYEQNMIAIFVMMVLVFGACSDGSIRLTRFVRFNIIQAILFDIGLTCVGQIYTLCPVEFRESYLIRNLIVNPFALGVLFALGYSCVLILLGRYPKFPVFTDAARLHTLSGRLDI